MITSRVLGALLSLIILPAHTAQLIVVEDKGGTTALPYYRALNPQSASTITAPSGKTDPGAAQGLPIRSKRLSAGQVQGRVINAPGLQPFFIVGDDESSRLWLLKHGDALRQMNAMGLIVNVESAERLAAMRSWVGDLQMSPTSGDDLAQRLGLEHYPALITATAIEQ